MHLSNTLFTCQVLLNIISPGVPGVIHITSDFVQRPLFLTFVYRRGLVNSDIYIHKSITMW